MEFEYTNNKDYKCAFLINDFERLLIVSALKSHKKKYFSSIVRVRSGSNYVFTKIEQWSNNDCWKSKSFRFCWCCHDAIKKWIPWTGKRNSSINKNPQLLLIGIEEGAVRNKISSIWDDAKRIAMEIYDQKINIEPMPENKTLELPESNDDDYGQV